MSRRKRFSATISVRQIRALAATIFLYRLAALVLRRTEAKGLSTTLVVLRCLQCFVGKSKKVSIRSQSRSRALTAFGNWALVSCDELLAELPGICKGVGVGDLNEQRPSLDLLTLMDLVDHVEDLVVPAPLLPGLWPDLIDRGPDAHMCRRRRREQGGSGHDHVSL